MARDCHDYAARDGLYMLLGSTITRGSRPLRDLFGGSRDGVRGRGGGTRKRFSFDLVAAGIVFLAVIIVPLVVTTVLAQSSDPDPEGDERNPRCFWIGSEYFCPPNPTRPPTAPPPPPPCNVDPVTFECLPPPGPTPTDPPDPTATDPPEPTATDPPEPTATDPPEPMATDPPEPMPTDPPEPTPTDPPEPTPTDPPTPTPVIIVIPPLNAPALSGRVSGTSLTLTWTEVTQADQYEVQERRVQCRTERGQQRCGEIWWLTVRSTTGLTETFSWTDRGPGLRVPGVQLSGNRPSDRVLGRANLDHRPHGHARAAHARAAHCHPLPRPRRRRLRCRCRR